MSQNTAVFRRKRPVRPTMQRASRVASNFFFNSSPAETEQGMLGFVVLAVPFPRFSALLRPDTPILCFLEPLA